MDVHEPVFSSQDKNPVMILLGLPEGETEELRQGQRISPVALMAQVKL
jgi:hypothetical protein